MSQLMSIFRYLLVPFHFLWKSGLLTIEKMTKSCSQLVKIDTSPASINHDEQHVFIRKDIDVQQQRRVSTNDIFRQSSQKFIQKLRNISLNSIITKNETGKPTSKEISITRQYSTEPIDKPKPRVSFTRRKSNPNFDISLQGILKTASRNTVFSNSVDRVYNDPPIQDDPTKMTDESRGSIGQTTNSTRVIKQVRFKEKTSKKRYPPCELIVNGSKLSDRQHKFLEKNHRRDSLNLQSVHLNSISSSNSSEFEESDCFESSEEDLIDGDE